jgi:NADH-quinone oxidoreductase subunit N
VIGAATPKIEVLPILPELILVGVGVVSMLAVAFVRRVDPGALLALSIAGVVGAAAASALLWDWDGGLTAIAGSVAVDRLAVVARLIVLGAAAIGLLYGYHAFGRAEQQRPEFYPLVLFATSGMTLIASAADLIVVFIALEILSLSLYVLTGISSRLGSVEGSMKYFLLGAFSSAFFLFGVAMAYGATGSTRLADVSAAVAGRTGSEALALASIALLAIGFGFKVSAVPFHMWTPDVYQGAPTPVTAFMSAATKVAAFAAFMRVFNVAFAPLAWDWTPVIWAMAAISVVVGSVLAFAQTDIKRLLAYSSIAHAGFILIGLSAPGQAGMSSALFYLVAYAATVIGAFGVVMLVSTVRGDERTEIRSYAGLARRSPFLAGLMTLFLFSLAGIPPTAGFIAKVSVFSAALSAGHWELALIGVIASVIAAGFYLRVVVVMYMQEPATEAEPDRSLLPSIAVLIPAGATLLLGVIPGLITGVLDKAAVLRW